VTELKRRPNNHRSKHKDKRSSEGYGYKKQRSLGEKKKSKYGLSIIVENETPSDD
jgi:hypothetical protein